MSDQETDCESIEFLEEDADIVQQCVKNDGPYASLQQLADAKSLLLDTDDEEDSKPLLVERPSRSTSKNRKRPVVSDSDSDYDPYEDLRQQQEVINSRRRKPPPPKKARVEKPPINIPAKKPHVVYNQFDNVDPKALSERRKKDIKVPDYADPTCLPVVAIKIRDSDIKKVKSWNKNCMEHLNSSDKLLQCESGVTKASMRAVVLRKVRNRISGALETTIWSKTTAESIEGDKKSEVVQGVLPNYKLKHPVREYQLTSSKVRRRVYHIDEAILSIDSTRTGNLIVYKPREMLSSLYNFVKEDDEVNTNKLMGKKQQEKDEDVKPHQILRETACVQICAPCYQYSWRGINTSGEKDFQCPVCVHSFVSVYNLLSHIKNNHSKVDVRRCRRQICRKLAKFVGYHYKCRICRQQFLTILELRKHVLKHKGNVKFRCDVCNKVTL